MNEVKAGTAYLESYLDVCLAGGGGDVDEPPEDDQTDAHYFRFDGRYWDTKEFMRLDAAGCPHPFSSEWDAYYSMSAFSSVLLKMSSSGDRVTVGMQKY